MTVAWVVLGVVLFWATAGRAPALGCPALGARVCWPPPARAPGAPAGAFLVLAAALWCRVAAAWEARARARPIWAPYVCRGSRLRHVFATSGRS